MLSRRRLLFGGFVVLILVGAAAAWLGYRALGARDELVAAREALTSVRDNAVAGDVDATRASLTVLQEHAGRAHTMTHDPLWAAAAAVPFAGDPVETVRGLTEAVDRIADKALPPLAEVAPAVTPSALRTGPSTVNVDALRTAAAPLASAASELSTATSTVAATPQDRLPAEVASARAELLTQLVDVGATLRTAQLAAEVLPGALGADGEKRWFLALQTPAEARGTGGLLGAYAVIEVDRGEIRLREVDTNGGLPQADRVAVDLPGDYHATWQGWASTELWINGGVSPHFPYAAQIWAAKWRSAGQPVDGVLAVDPFVLGYLLETLGEVTVDGHRLDGANAATFVLEDAYRLYPDNDEREDVLRRLMRETFGRLLTGAGEPRGLVEAFARGVQEGRVLAAMPDAPEQEILAGTRMGGAIPESPQRFAGVYVNDAGGSKLDTYTTRTIDYRTGACTDGRRVVTTTLVLGNDAPRRDLPDYVVTRADNPDGEYPPGQRRAYVSFYGSAEAELISGSFGDEPGTFEVGQERGHPVWSTFVLLDPGESVTVSVRSSEPARAEPVELRYQPLVREPKVTISDGPC